MKFINTFNQGDNILDVYFIKNKQFGVKKNGGDYISITLQDKTGTIDAKIWEIDKGRIKDFEASDYCFVSGTIESFKNQLQLKIVSIRKADESEYDVSDYLPITDKNIDTMYQEFLDIIGSLNPGYYKKLCEAFFVEDQNIVDAFKYSSAAKSVHHSFIGGLLEHTLSVTKLCDFYTTRYPMLNRGLLLTAAMLHDIAKIRELSPFPENEYTDDGLLIGHIVMGCEMIGEKIRNIPDFPHKLETELKHCIVAHHGECEFGSPKKPALMEAMALHLADNTDAKMETFTESFKTTVETDWLGYNKFLNTNIRKTSPM